MREVIRDVDTLAWFCSDETISFEIIQSPLNGELTNPKFPAYFLTHGQSSPGQKVPHHDASAHLSHQNLLLDDRFVSKRIEGILWFAKFH